MVLDWKKWARSNNFTSIFKLKDKLLLYFLNFLSDDFTHNLDIHSIDIRENKFPWNKKHVKSSKDQFPYRCSNRYIDLIDFVKQDRRYYAGRRKAIDLSNFMVCWLEIYFSIWGIFQDDFVRLFNWRVVQ